MVVAVCALTRTIPGKPHWLGAARARLTFEKSVAPIANVIYEWMAPEYFLPARVVPGGIVGRRAEPNKETGPFSPSMAGPATRSRTDNSPICLI